MKQNFVLTFLVILRGFLHGLCCATLACANMSCLDPQEFCFSVSVYCVHLQLELPATLECMSPLLVILSQGAPGTQKQDVLFLFIEIYFYQVFFHTRANCTCLSKCSADKINFSDDIHSLLSCRILWELFKGSSPADRDLSCREYLIHRAGSEGKLLLCHAFPFNELQLRCHQFL